MYGWRTINGFDWYIAVIAGEGWKNIEGSLKDSWTASWSRHQSDVQSSDNEQTFYGTIEAS
jgi:hypothetical protein